MNKIIKISLCLLLAFQFVFNPINVGANDFSEAKRIPLKKTIKMHMQWADEEFFKIKVKKKGKYTISVDTKARDIMLYFYTKNGNDKSVRMVSKKQKQGYVTKLDSSCIGFSESDVTGKIKCSCTLKLKKGTYVMRYYYDDFYKDYSVKIKTKFKKCK